MLYPVKVFLVREWRVKDDAVVVVKLVARHDVVNCMDADEHDVQVRCLSGEKPEARSCKIHCAVGELLQLRNEMANSLACIRDQLDLMLVHQRFDGGETKGTQLSLSLRHLLVQHDFKASRSDSDGNRSH